MSRRRALVICGLLTAIVALAAVPARSTYGTQVSVDEPQYLLTALSLWDDLDLDISDEIADEAYLPFHEVPLNQQTIPLNDSGQRISPHDPLLPALTAVPMGLGGWRAVRAMLAVVAGLAAVMTAATAIDRLGVRPRLAAVVVTATYVTPPLVSYGSQVYPEIVAACCVATAVWATSAPAGRHVAVALASVVALPWLSVKYGLAAAALAAWLTWREYRAGGVRRVLPLGVALAMMGLAYLAIHQRIYGGWTVYAAGDHFVGGEFEVVGTDPAYATRTQRVWALLVDRGFGLVAWSPMFALLPAALFWWVRRPLAESSARWAAAVFAAGWATATWVALTMHGWWWPGRQVVHVLPVAVLALVVLADRSRVVRRTVSLLGAVASLNWLWLVVEASTDRRALIVDFADTAAPMYRAIEWALPNHRSPEWHTPIVSGAWVVSFAVLVWLTRPRAAAGQGDDVEAAPGSMPAQLG